VNSLEHDLINNPDEWRHAFAKSTPTRGEGDKSKFHIFGISLNLLTPLRSLQPFVIDSWT
jgi:hypothetical protein